MKWFAKVHDGFGVQLFDTEAEAREFAEDILNEIMADPDGLPECMDRAVVWGKVLGMPKQTVSIETPDGEFDHLEEWEMRSPDEEVTVVRKRRWTDDHGDEHEETLKGGG